MFKQEEDKLKIIEHHLYNDQYILIHLNPLFEGVAVPPQFKNSSKLTLKFSYHFTNSTLVNKDGISAELLFGTENYPCFVPMGAIWGCTTADDENYLWPKSIQPETYQELQANLSDVQEAFKDRPILAVKENTKAKDKKQQDADRDKNKNRSKAKLKLIK